MPAIRRIDLIFFLCDGRGCSRTFLLQSQDHHSIAENEEGCLSTGLEWFIANGSDRHKRDLSAGPSLAPVSTKKIPLTL